VGPRPQQRGESWEERGLLTAEDEQDDELGDDNGRGVDEVLEVLRVDEELAHPEELKKLRHADQAQHTIQPTDVRARLGGVAVRDDVPVGVVGRNRHENDVEWERPQ
jgi:hypothetical protein